MEGHRSSTMLQYTSAFEPAIVSTLKFEKGEGGAVKGNEDDRTVMK